MCAAISKTSPSPLPLRAAISPAAPLRACALRDAGPFTASCPTGCKTGPASRSISSASACAISCDSPTAGGTVRAPARFRTISSSRRWAAIWTRRHSRRSRAPTPSGSRLLTIARASCTVAMAFARSPKWPAPLKSGPAPEAAASSPAFFAEWCASHAGCPFNPRSNGIGSVRAGPRISSNASTSSSSVAVRYPSSFRFPTTRSVAVRTSGARTIEPNCHSRWSVSVLGCDKKFSNEGRSYSSKLDAVRNPGSR